jgi:hypothetical protein
MRLVDSLRRERQLATNFVLVTIGKRCPSIAFARADHLETRRSGNPQWYIRKHFHEARRFREFIASIIKVK